jgi:hypothetical protein
MALSAAAALLLVTTVHAQQPAPASPPPPLPDYGPNITLDQATAAANAALAEAKKLNVVEGIAVVDTAGRLVYFMKMDNARAAAVELAQHKARTAAMYKLPSKAYEQRLAGGPRRPRCPHARRRHRIGGRHSDPARRQDHRRNRRRRRP